MFKLCQYSVILLVALLQDLVCDPIDSCFVSVYNLLRNSSDQSEIVDSSIVSSEKLEYTFHYLSPNVDKRMFCNYKSLKMLRVFAENELLHTLQIFFLKMDRSTINKIKVSMTGRTIGNIQSEMWNKYYVYFTSETIVFVESFVAIDNGFMKRLHNYFCSIELEASRYNRNDSLYYCDTLLKIQEIFNSNDKVIDNMRCIQPVDSLRKTYTIITGLTNKEAVYNSKWIYKNDSSSTCLALKVNNKIPVQAAVKLIYDKEPFIEKKSEKENYYLQYRSKCYAPITLWIDNNNCIEMITLRKLNEKQKTPCRMCLN